MKAIVYTKHGGPDVLQLKEVEKPTLKEDEVEARFHKWERKETSTYQKLA
jgi:NADPH:quinone reductase-like Zn-dependent oxidoreductase